MLGISEKTNGVSPSYRLFVFFFFSFFYLHFNCFLFLLGLISFTKVYTKD